MRHMSKLNYASGTGPSWSTALADMENPTILHVYGQCKYLMVLLFLLSLDTGPTILHVCGQCKYILVLLFLLSLDNGEKTTINIKSIEPDVSFPMPNDNDNFISTNGPTQKWPVLSRVRD